jgi:ABC-2 type transport system permease protein
VPVYDRRYRPWTGDRAGARPAVVTIARHALRRVTSSRLALVLFALACVPPLLFAGFIYSVNNLEMLAAMGIRVGDETVDASTFFIFLVVQSGVGFLLAALVGPSLIAPDLAHGAMPLYLSRPLGRLEYAAGKLAVLAGLLSLITWIPGLLLVGLQGALAPGWLAAHVRVAVAMVVGSWVWIALISLVALAISAWVRWRPLATAMLFIVFLVGEAFGRAVNAILDTRWGQLVILDDLVETIWLAMFGPMSELGRMVAAEPLPLGVALGAVAAASALAGWLLLARVRAVEVTR